MKTYCLILAMTLFQCSSVNNDSPPELFGQYETMVENLKINDSTNVVHFVIWEFSKTSYDINHFTDTIVSRPNGILHNKLMFRFGGPIRIAGDTIYFTTTQAGFIQNIPIIYLDQIEMESIGDPPKEQFYRFRKLDLKEMEINFQGNLNWTKVQRNSPKKNEF